MAGLPKRILKIESNDYSFVISGTRNGEKVVIESDAIGYEKALEEARSLDPGWRIYVPETGAVGFGGGGPHGSNPDLDASFIRALIKR